MANVFGILTAVLLALAAFVAFKNKDAYQNEVNHRQAEQGKLAASQERLKTAQGNLAATQKELSDTRAEVAKLKETEAAQKKTNDGLKEQIETKTAETGSNKTKLDEIKAKIAEIGNIGEIVGKVKAMKESVEDSNQQIAANTAKLANLTSENTRIEAFIEVLRNQEKMVSNKESYFKSAAISNIYPNWGFVTLSAGSTSGVVAGSTLEVVRDGQPVARLLVSAVENNTASASIVPNSLAQDAVLMVGDKVVPTSKPAEPAKPVAAPAAAPEDAPAAAPAAPAAEDKKEAAPAGDKLDLGADPFAEPAKPAEKEN